ncbi:MAG: protein-export chaperone SecB [Hyphomicrobiaceae bacterium]|nr:protein-export chaperone SecB [Hyphomicrobiaceae bacterium]
MSDDKAKNGNGSAKQEKGEEQAQFNVLAQFIKDLSFESPNTPESLRGPGEDPNLQVDVTVGADKVEDDIYEVVINFEADATNKAGAIYKMEMVYGGLFRLANMPEHIRHPVLFVNCPTLLFPFLRRIIADLTREGGFPPLMLDPIDFAGLYQQNLDKANADKKSKADS